MRAHTVAPLQNASRGLLTHKTNGVCPPVFRTQHPDLRRRRIDFCCHSSYARVLPEISAKNFPRNLWWAYFNSFGKKKFPITSQALFPSDLEGVIHSRYTLQPPYLGLEFGYWCTLGISLYVLDRKTSDSPYWINGG